MAIEYTCIACPLGCHLQLDDSDKAAPVISGNKCPRGRTYALEEYSDPKRVVTTTVQSTSTVHPRIPVKTDKALPKAHIQGLLDHLHALEIPLPVRCGDVLVTNFQGTGVSVFIARSFEG